MECATQSSFENVFHIFSSKYTSGLVSRQEQALSALLHEHKDGFKVNELGEAESLIYLLLDQVSDDNFLPYLCDVVLTCGKPFIRNKANAEYRAVDSICSLLLAIGRCLESSFVHLKVAAAEVLYSFAKGHDKKGPRRVDISKRDRDLDVEDMRPSSWSFNQHLLDQSGVVEVAVMVFNEEVQRLFSHDADGDGIIDEHEYAMAQDHVLGDESSGPPVFMVSLMKMAFEMSSYRANALTLIRLKTPLLMARVVSSLRDFRKEEVGLMVQVLWNVIEHSIDRLGSRIAANRVQLLDKYRNANALYVLGNAETVQMLCTLLERLLLEGHQVRDKELRNEVIIVSTMLASRSENHIHFHDTGFLSILLLYATAAEMELPTGCDIHHFATTDKNDLQMKMLTWHLITTLCKHETPNLVLASDSLIMRTALSYLDPHDSCNAIKQNWSPAQLAVLQRESLTLLFQFVPDLPEQYRQLGGTAVFLSLIRTQPAQNLIESALCFLRVSCSYEGITEEIRDQGGVETMLDIVCTATTTMVMKEHSLSLLAKLCDSNVANQTMFRRSGGVHALLQLLEYDTTNLSIVDEVYDEVVHCVWKAVVSNRKSESQFITALGIEKLLSLLEESPIGTKYIVLGCLSDIMHNPAAGPYFAGWKSDQSGVRAVELLLNLWIQVGNATAWDAIDSSHQLSNKKGVDAAAALLQQQASSKQATRTLEIDTSRPLEYFQCDPGETNRDGTKRLKGNLSLLMKALQSSKSQSNDPPLAESPRLQSNNEDVVDGEAYTRLNAKPELKKIVLGMRSRIYCVLEAAGFETICDEDLAKDQHVALSVVQHFASFVKGLAWESVVLELKSKDVKPILDDRIMIQSQLEELNQLAKSVYDAQVARIEEETSREEQRDDEFFGKILSQRDQEIQFLLLNNRAKRPTSITLAKRQENKLKKQNMLERSKLLTSDSLPSSTSEQKEL